MVIGGDFNVCRFEGERLNCTRRSSATQGFSNTIFDLELIDPPLQGVQFTWSRGEETFQASRIDRSLYTSEWNEMFTAIKQYTMPRVISDHEHLILEHGDWEASLSYFFENMWLQEESFIDMIKGRWQSYIIQGTQTLGGYRNSET